MDSKTEQQLLKWFDEVPSGDEAVDSNSDIDEAPSDHVEENTDSEQSDENNVSEMLNVADMSSRVPIMVGKNGMEWLKHKPHKTKLKTAQANIITKLPGVRPIAKNATTILDCWKLFFSDEVIQDIVRYTNQKLRSLQSLYKRERDCLPTDYDKINAFIGVLYMAGVLRSQHLHTYNLWSSDGTAPEFFAAVMSERRFHIILRAIRFDDSDTREERRDIDNLAPIRELFEHINQRCSACYTVGIFTTIDEMLEGFRGRCKFRQYIANKPAKYGIKIYSLADAKIFYTYNMEIYAGKQPEGPYNIPNDASSVVKRLIVPISKSGRNITMDNYFTSVPLVNELYTNHKLTVVGTLRKNKPHIPADLLSVKNRPVCSSVFAYGQGDNKCVLVSYVPHKNKNVLVLSSYHDDDSIDPEPKDAFKPEIITFYNKTKGGVDVVDRMKSEYSVTRKSNRWPFTIFCTLLNVTTINSQIIYAANTQIMLKRRQYITDLAKQLTAAHLQKRASISTLSIALRQKISNICGHKNVIPTKKQQGNAQPKPRCEYCPLRKNRFTQHSCANCSSPICKEHTASTRYLCVECHGKNAYEDSDS
ncbi:piggyBac transposable element-derived protein 3-like [Sitophilus oryzae]|uniref:PiggyBac transposable element-derived protein 3-like n=1 Tax=Sitophilus oryzae TaxID=7048 RepID=A0A6J2Y4S9_SITOR|nr:piggyBac transposable element-derived protein 3-like [Sitophilus oryzae]